MAQNRITLPSGTGGIVRYFDEYRSKLEFKPGHIVVICLAVIVIMIILYLYGARLMGI